MKKKVLISLAVFVMILLGLYGALLIFDKFRKPTHVRTFGEYNIGIISDRLDGLCGIEKVWRVNDPHWKDLFRVSICEDNVEAVFSEGDLLILRTSCGRELRKNLMTGEQVQGQNEEKQCFGGGFSFK